VCFRAGIWYVPKSAACFWNAISIRGAAREEYARYIQHSLSHSTIHPLTFDMKWYQKVSAAGAVGIASASFLIGIGDKDIDKRPQLERTRDAVTPISDGEAKLKKIDQYLASTIALTGSISFLIAARLYRRVKPFRLYATASAFMLAIIPCNYFLLHRAPRTESQKSNALERVSNRKWELAIFRTLLGTVAAACGIYAKATA
jgi:hypothetical protein